MEDSMEDNLKQAARDCIQTRYVDLSSAIKNATPTTIGNDLVQVGMVSDEITHFETGLNKNDQASKLMRVVSSTVDVTPESIMKFIKVLCDSKDPTCNDLGEKMKKEMGKAGLTDTIQKLASMDQQHQSKSPDIDPDVAKASMGATVEMEITNIGCQGYPGVGKTSVLDLAMGKDPAPTRTSTDCIDPPSRYLMIDNPTEGVEWENVTTDKMFELTCKAMKKTIEENPILSGVPAVTTTNQSATVSLDEPPYTVFPDLLKELSSSESSGVIFDSHWMMVTDCGGQPPFLDAAALFHRNSCLHIFPVKLNEPLNKVPDFTYFVKDEQPASFDEDCVPLTHKQIIETLAKSVASIQPPNTPSATKCPTGAKFTIVGTFQDKAHECSETVEEKESILKQVLKPYEPFRVQLGKKVILPVNAALGNDTEVVDAGAMKKRAELTKTLRKLFKKSDVSLKVKIKLRWFGLLLNILTIAEKEQRAVLTLDQCYKLGDTLGMGKSETKQAIRFFHDISLIMHFDTPKLRDYVIIDTKPVLNMLSRMISVSFLDEEFLADHYHIVLPSGAKELLQYHGRFSVDTLKKCVRFNEHITLPFFLDILEHVRIAVAIDKEYFMPCALSYAPEPSVSESSPPWVIRLRRKDIAIPIPVGYLPAIVVFLLTKFSSHFSTDRTHRQYRNMIKLRYKSGGYVYLIERHLQLEIYFSNFEYLPNECTTIRDLVLKSIKLTEEKLHIIQIGEGAITKVDSFLCSCGKGSAHHTCAYNPLSEILECEETTETGESCKLDPRHVLWLGDDESEDKSEDEGENEREDEREDKSEDRRDDIEDEAKTNFATVKKHIEQEGSVDVLSLKSYLIGPPCVGKTTTRKRLTGEIVRLSRNEKVSSTGFDASEPVLLYRDTEEKTVLITKEWKCQNLVEQFQALCSCILNTPSNSEDNTVQLTAINVQENSNELIQSASTELSPVVVISESVKTTNSLKKREPSVPTFSGPEISDTESTDDESPSPSGHSTVSSQARQDHKEDEITSSLSSLFEKKDWKGIGEILKSKSFTLLHIIDIGGQPEFHEILPLLLHGLAINLIFLNMSQDMTSPYTVTYRGTVHSDHKPKYHKYESEFTVRDVIQSALSTISSLQSNNSAPTAILVGTHLDKCNEEDVSALEKSVRDSFGHFINSDVLCPVDDESPEKYIHQVDNVSGVSDIARLRKQITNIIDSDRFERKPVPTTTLLLYLILRKQFSPNPGWCKLKDCVEIAERFGISEKALTEEGGILQYLHESFGTILYYRGKTRQGKKLKISQRVIVNPDVIMRPPVELVVTAFGAKGNLHVRAKKIRFTGEIDHYWMKKACEKDRPSDDKIPTDEIVELLESRYILHQDTLSASGKQVYFFPCLLSPDRNVTRQSQNRSHLNSLTYAPLLLLPLDEEHIIPPGLFPATIVKLSQLKQHWILFNTDFKKDAEQTRFRNRIRFIFEGELEVELRTLSTHIECRIIRDAKKIESQISKPSEDTIPQLIPKCRSKLGECFQKVLSSFPHTKDWKWDFGFYCPHALLSNKILEPHPARCTQTDEPGQKVSCSRQGCGHGVVDLEEKHKCWFTEIPSEQLVQSTESAEGAPPALLDLTKMKGAEGKPLKDEVPSMKKQREADFEGVGSCNLASEKTHLQDPPPLSQAPPSSQAPPPSEGPRHRGRVNDSPANRDERKSEAAEGNRSSMLCGVVLGVLILVFAVCAVFLIIFMFIFLSSYLLPRNIEPGSNIEAILKQPATKHCHEIDRPTDVYFILKQEFSISSTKEFGLILGLTYAELDMLKEESREKSTEFLIKVVESWYKQIPPPACWETIHIALWKLPNRPLANKVKQKYMTD